MPGLTTLRDAACARLRTALPDARVESMAGGVDAATVLRESVGATTVFVLALSAANAAASASLAFDLSAALAALVVVNGRKNRTARETDGLAAAEATALALHGQTFGLSVSPARVLGIAPVADEELDAKGVWVWAVTWEQRLVLEAS